MSSTLSSDRRARNYRKRGAVVGVIAGHYGTSPEALHQRELALEAAYLHLLASYRLRGNRAALLRNLQRVTDEVEVGPVLPFGDSLLSDGRTDRAQDESRELCLHQGATTAEIRVYITRTRRELDEKRRALRSAEQELTRRGTR